MTNIQLTPNGVPKLMQLTGRFHDTNIFVQVLYDTWPQYDPARHPLQKIKPYEDTLDVVVSDGIYYTSAIISVTDRSLLPQVCYPAVIRVRKAAFCSSVGCAYLLLENPEPVGTPDVILGEPFCDPPPEENTFGGNCVPISALKYFQDKSIPHLRVLVTYKSRLGDPRHKSERFPFILHVLDESSETRAYAFKQVALELYDRFEVGKVYYISGFDRCTRPDLRYFFYNLPEESVGLQLTRRTIIEECHDVHGLPVIRFDFIPIPTLRKLKLEEERRVPPRPIIGVGKSVDVIGIVYKVGPLETVMTQINDPIPKRDVIICDQSGLLLPTELWSYNAEEFSAQPGTIVAFRHAKLLEIEEPGLNNTPARNYRKLSAVTPSTIHIEPSVEESFALRNWRRSDPDLSVIPDLPEVKGALFGSLCDS
ncbi:hypothetical protein P691DRAFT_774077 [Macrolepiota fuliginosa MF-IS2]|uniref:Replication protein A OB domain-containing protein n=1 Tax=Macrolepiota fuliginosa MF-IS2 TaxID=1400762 RepID=A0A9P5XF62_9AGAR|nr:hypothetical protein P691DRAFT_774077 [Macrolepiota fuliginosa MF-IS2]